ncbi:MAG: DUF1566 domain-containing protein [Pseudoalteromonas prydzensis]|uniref:Lcl C-terminal domain-containing protein n=1 Tax=Pseudoalteromonas prydzensis TaxID=182141 RepID=UPI0024BCA242|nr:DUF1566 domain-containing protein [Pseudoalteromonas prydzensis]
MKLNIIITCAVFVLSCSNVSAQVCYDNVSETTQISRFIDNEDGTVTDSATGLMWQRCSIGQTYNSENGGCEGDIKKVDWGEALRAAKNNRLADYSDWQVPNIKELASIVEHQCVKPSIKIDIFPNTQNVIYWTSTTEKTNVGFAWVYFFDTGSNELAKKNNFNYLRLVRYEE